VVVTAIPHGWHGGQLLSQTFGLRYNDNAVDRCAQTGRRGGSAAGEGLAWRLDLTGHFDSVLLYSGFALSSILSKAAASAWKRRSSSREKTSTPARHRRPLETTSDP
jgi:hypothetical protein